ncbi:MAG: DNA-directed RNA polymerase subunit alpha [Patescibacteria group bacterium]|nr:DNA-directed RNA polymerase subunit alpha [Patescibacteria group bacterium]
MEIIPIAKKVEYHEVEKSKGQKGSFIIEPLYPGYGLTVGNALRRVLLSSLSGAAIVAIKIKGVDHEFSTLEYVKEDVVDIILNLKQVRIKLADIPTEPIKIVLNAKGEKEVTAGDFSKMAGVEILNPDLKIVTLTDKAASFELEAYVEFGRGYDPVETREKKDYEVGVMAIDALYSPVKRVGYEIENMRVGEMTNWDRVTLNIETDGTSDCEEVFAKAVSILVDQFSALMPAMEEKPAKVKKGKKEKEEIKEEVVAEEQPIEIKVADVS